MLNLREINFVKLVVHLLVKSSNKFISFPNCAKAGMEKRLFIAVAQKHL